MFRGLVYLILTILAPFPVWAAVGTSAAETWYVVAGCANNGDGLAQDCAASPGDPGAWNDPASVIWTATTGVDDADTLYICGTYTQKFLTVGSSVSAPVGSEIKIRWDCPGNPGLMRNVYTLTTATTGGNWTEGPTNVWSIDVSSLTWEDPQRVWLDTGAGPVEILVSDTKANLGTQINGGTPVSKWFYDGAAGLLYLYSVGNPATGLTSLQGLFGSGANDYAPVRINGASIAGIDLINPNIEGGALASIYTLGPKRIRIFGENTDRSLCHVGRHSARAILLQGSSTSGTGTNNEDIEIYNCDIDLTFPAHLKDYRFELNTLGNTIEVTGSTRVKITNNRIADGSHAQIYFYSIGGNDSVIDGLVTQNDITCSDYVAYCRLLNVDGDAIGRTSNNWFTRNKMTNQTIRSQFNGNNNHLVGNLIGAVRQNFVLKSGTTAFEQLISFEKYAGVSQDNEVDHNTLYDDPWAPCIEYRNSGLSSTGHKITNNIIDNCGSATYTGQSGAQGAAVHIPTGFTGNVTISNNLIYPQVAGVVSYRGTQYNTVAAFQAACSGGDTCTGNKTGDPLFVGAPADLRPGVGSPAINSGSNPFGCVSYDGLGCSFPSTIGGFQLANPPIPTLRMY